MLAKKIKPFTSNILVDGVVCQVQHVEILGDAVSLALWILDTNTYYTLECWADDNIVLCTWEGIPTEGRTEAEVNAWTWLRRFKGVEGYAATVTVQTTGDYVYATVSIRDLGIDVESISACWATRISGGRKTTRLVCALHYRGLFRDKRRKSSARLTMKAFRQQANWFLTMAEIRAEHLASTTS